MYVFCFLVYRLHHFCTVNRSILAGHVAHFIETVSNLFFKISFFLSQLLGAFLPVLQKLVRRHRIVVAV